MKNNRCFVYKLAAIICFYSTMDWYIKLVFKMKNNRKNCILHS